MRNRFSDRGVEQTRALVVVLLAALASLLAASAAGAYTPSGRVLYVAPNPKTSPPPGCTGPTDGCDLTTIVGAPGRPGVAQEGDEVIVEPGEYDTSLEIANSHNIFLHGDFASATRPTIRFDLIPPASGLNPPTAMLIGGVAARIGTPGAIVSYLDIEAPSAQNPVIALSMSGEGSIAEQILARSSANLFNGGACVIAFGQLRDSVCIATGPGASAVRIAGSGLPISLDNVDALATSATGVGITVQQTQAGDAFHATLSNVIARGGTNGEDIVADQLNFAADAFLAGSTLDVALSNSNYDPAKLKILPGYVTATFDEQDGNQSDPPKFADPAHDDYSEADDSPTLGAGFTDPFDNGPLDFLRLPRQFYGITDIGAYQHPVPQPQTTTTTTTPPPPTTTTTTTPPPPTTTTTTSAPPPDRTPPAFSAVSLKPGSFAVLAGRKKKRIHYGASLTFSLSEPASVVGTVALKTKGRLVGKTCKKQTRSNRKRRSCVLYVQKGRLVGTSFLAGASTVALNGKVGARKLAPGVYRLRLVGTDAAKNASLPRNVQFKIVKG